MSQFGSNGCSYYPTQGYPNFNGSSNSEFNMAQPYGQHRASDPLQYMQYSQLASVGRELPLQQLTKPETNLPWNSQFRSGYQQQAFSQPTWPGRSKERGAMTEPVPNHETYMHRSASQKGSDFSDSGYVSVLNSTGPQDNFNPDKNELEQNFQQTGYPFKSEQGDDDNHLPINRPAPPQSVKSEGHRLAPPRDIRRRQAVPPCPYPGCTRKPKNLSDAKKHSLTHTKPYSCTEPGCPRNEGFATDNDLQRHRKSVHNLTPTVGSTAGYICAACTTPESSGPRKFWPRRDNFKAHIKRKHPNYDEGQLINLSKQTMRPDDTRTVEDDNNTVRSAMRSARQSQIDPVEGHGYQLSSNMSRNTSDQSEYQPIFPDSAIDMRQDAFAAMGGHTHDINSSYSQYDMSSTGDMNGSGLDVLSNIAGDVDFSETHLPTSPFKKPKLDHEDSSTAPQFQVTISEANTTSGSSTTQSTSTSSNTQGDFTCQECGKVKRRECDLKKHMKRHTRPYGCTFPSCQKKFGSRNDWKRHESSQHYLSEMWKCTRPRIDQTPCARRPFQHIDQLKKHLRGPDHNLHDEILIDSECAKYRLGREGHDHFWCGFCNCLISQQRQLQNAWDARFKHIGDHFDKEGRDSGDWVCVEENKAKRYFANVVAEGGGGGKFGRKGRGGGGFREDEEEAELPEWEPELHGANDGGSGLGAQHNVNVDVYGYEMGDMFAEGGKRKFEVADDDAEGESDNELY